MPENMTPEERADFIHRVEVLSEKLDVSERQRAETERLAAETRAIAEESHKAAETAQAAADANEQTARRQRWFLGGLLLLLVVVAFFVNEQRVDGEQIAENAVTACTGGNDRLAAQQSLWDGIVLQSKAETPEEAEALKAISDYVALVFKPRDCDHLDVPYEAPDEFPDLGLD